MQKIDINDTYNLQRFVDAQDTWYEIACSELRNGCKREHWMWFIFPQMKGLGRSWTSEKFAISSREEAEAYLDHSILGPRLRESSRLVTLVEGRSINQIFGGIDSVKFRSSMTLFANVTSDNAIFMDALKKYFGGQFDHLTLKLL
jgi:uncharacterized protein (DUF1810 family)